MNKLKLLLGALAFYGRFFCSFTAIGFHARRLFWPRFQPDFRGQHWVVTGASAGIGRYIALAAARAGANVTAVARASAKLDEVVAAAELEGLQLHAAPCDLSLMADVDRWLAQRVAAIEDTALAGIATGQTAPVLTAQRVDVLVNNAGVMLDEHTLTAEGHEASFATNLLGHYRLTTGLVNAGLLPSTAMVVNLTSGGAYHVPLSTAMLNVKDAARYNGTYAYAFHKRAQIVLSEYWRNTWAAIGRRSYVLHPGWVDTPGVKRSLPRFRAALKRVLRDEAAGADTALWLAATKPAQPTGEHIWFDRKARAAHVAASTRVSRDTAETLVGCLEKAP
jgi:dehydrogenase/reductase SDR family protein 12